MVSLKDIAEITSGLLFRSAIKPVSDGGHSVIQIKDTSNNIIDWAKLSKVNISGGVREDYSGRGMFGEHCLGIVCSDANRCLEVAGSKGITGGKIDNMGLDMIVYWPNLKSNDDVKND